MAARAASGHVTLADDPGLIFEACRDLARMLRDTPTTPLLATMWAEEVVHRGQRAAGELADSVAELMDRYERRLLAPAAQGNEATINRLSEDAAAIAVRELGSTFQPGYVTHADIMVVLRELDMHEPERRLALLKTSRLLEAPSESSDLLRIAPDPVAEHMAARARVKTLGADLPKWEAFLRELRAQKMPEGFLVALRNCCRHRVYGRDVPTQVRTSLEKAAAGVAKRAEAVEMRERAAAGGG